MTRAAKALGEREGVRIQATHLHRALRARGHYKGWIVRRTTDRAWLTVCAERDDSAIL